MDGNAQTCEYPKGSLVYGYYVSRKPRFFRVFESCEKNVTLVAITPTQNEYVATTQGQSYGEPFKCPYYSIGKEVYLLDSEVFLLKPYPGGNAKRKGNLYFDRILLLRGKQVHLGKTAILL